MEDRLSTLGTGVGALGCLIAAVAGVARLTGHYHLAGFESMTLFHGGVGLIVAGCFLKLHAGKRS